MSEALYPKHRYEPKVPPLVSKSFVSVPSVDMRLAPEILVLELMREVFFERFYGNPPGARKLNPDELDEEKRPCFSVKERTVLYALRGRRKRSKNSSAQRFFAPAYPQLAERGWLGKDRDRVVNNLLLSGPIAQCLWSRGPDTEDGKRRQEELVTKIWRALLGGNSCLNENLKGKEILAVFLGPKSFNDNPDLPKRNLRDKTKYRSSVMRVDEDELANRITQDLEAICDLESKLPRMQWLQLLMTFLRLALPMWLLAQMQITRLVHAWLIDAVDKGSVESTDCIRGKLALRNRGLLHPTMIPTRELLEHIELYMKCRVEVSILLYCLEEVRKDRTEGRILSIREDGSGLLSIHDLLILASEAAPAIRGMERFKHVAGDLKVQAFLTREGEKFAAWCDPRTQGQGKNIDEFFRVLYRAELGDEAGGYLLDPEGRGTKRGFKVFPGQMLLRTVTYLTGQGKGEGAGKLTLRDVEEHFGQYGIDFSTAAAARPLLMKDLQSMGLLTGSPDAGSSVAISRPY